MSFEDRRRRMLEYISRQGTVTISDLASRFQVSEMTVHRDLNAMAGQELVNKVHGGAVAKHVQEIPFRARGVNHKAEKLAVANWAGRLVRTGMTLYLAPGTTVAELARALPRSGLTIITNSLPTAQELTLESEHDIHLTGGQVRRYAEALVGTSVRAAFDEGLIHLAFIAVTGIDLERGLTVYSKEEAEVLRWAIKSARRTVLLTDASKYDRVMGPEVLPLSAVHTLISTGPVPVHYSRYCRENDIELLTVPLNETLTDD